MKILTRWIAMALLLVMVLTMLPMSASASGATKRTGGKLIALTFDDGPGPYTARLLDGLAERGVHVTFFMLGSQAQYYPETIRRVYAEGHQIASHSYDHPELSARSDEQIRWQVSRTREILNDTLDESFDYIVRPPYGDYNSRVLSALGVPAILWSVDPLDWKYRNAYTVRDNIVSAARDGSIVLAHDIHSTTVDGALMAIDILLERGYEFVTVKELFRRRGQTLSAGHTYSSCGPNGTDLGPVSAPEIEYLPRYGGSNVRLSADAGATIYYTLDGSDPLKTGKRYTAPFPVEIGQTVRAFAAFDKNGSRSESISEKVGTAGLIPVLSVRNGKLVLQNPNPNSDLRYTTDGSIPNETSPIYTEPIDFYNGVLRFFAIGDGVRTAIKTIYVTKAGNLFWDVPNTEWYFDEVDRATTLGLFNGTDIWTFSPEENLTRAMFVTTLYRLMEKRGTLTQPEGKLSFPDVEVDQYYTDATLWAAENGLVLGYEDHTFRLDATITREEMCVILARLLSLLEVEQPETKLDFADRDEISDWAEESVAWLVACGIINGRENHCFVPQDTTTRAEAATVLLRLYDLLEDVK